LETLMIGVGVFIAYKVAILPGRTPIGWSLLTISFGLAFIRALVFLYVYLVATTSELFWVSVGQLLGLPIVALVLGGVYYLYQDFQHQIKERQAALVAPPQ